MNAKKKIKINNWSVAGSSYPTASRIHLAIRWAQRHVLAIGKEHHQSYYVF